MTLSTWFKKNNLPSIFEDDYMSFKDSNFFSPKADIVEKDKVYLIDLEIPGVEKDEITISIKDNVLSVTGERKNYSEKKDGNYFSFERSYGQFERSWVINDIEEDKIDAQYKDGILHISLPKKDEAIKRNEEKKIKVN